MGRYEKVLYNIIYNSREIIFRWNCKRKMVGKINISKFRTGYELGSLSHGEFTRVGINITRLTLLGLITDRDNIK